MAVGAHPILKSVLSEQQYERLRAAFWRWQLNGPDAHYLFGRDTAYSAPKVNGQYLLRHVHLAPLEDADSKEQWDAAWQAGRERTSDKALVYICRGEGNKRICLLIAVLPQGHAHAIANMTTAEDRAVMEGFARIAEHFMDTGTILVEPEPGAGAQA